MSFEAPLFDELLIDANTVITGSILVRASRLITQRVKSLANRVADTAYATVTSVNTGPPATLTVQFADGTSTDCRYLDLPAAKTPTVGDRVHVVFDNNHATVTGRLA